MIYLGWFVHTSDLQASSWQNGTSTQLHWVLSGSVWLVRHQHPPRTDQWLTRSTPHDQWTNSDSISQDLSIVKEYIPFQRSSRFNVIQIDHLARSFLCCIIIIINMWMWNTLVSDEILITFFIWQKLTIFRPINVCINDNVSLIWHISIVIQITGSMPM